MLSGRLQVLRNMLRRHTEAIVQNDVGTHPPVSIKVVCHHLEFALQGMGDDISPKVGTLSVPRLCSQQVHLH